MAATSNRRRSNSVTSVASLSQRPNDESVSLDLSPDGRAGYYRDVAMISTRFSSQFLNMLFTSGDAKQNRERTQATTRLPGRAIPYKPTPAKMFVAPGTDGSFVGDSSPSFAYSTSRLKESDSAATPPSAAQPLPMPEPNAPTSGVVRSPAASVVGSAICTSAARPAFTTT